MDNREIALIEDCQMGNKASFADLYDIYVDKIYNFIYAKVYDNETAEDLTSETFFKALEKINSFKIQENATFLSWLYRIAHNKVIDHYRKAKEDVNIDDVIDTKAEEFDIGTSIDNKQKLKEVFEFFETLKPEHKQILVMRIWDGLSYKEIAEITGKTEGNCKKIVSRTLSTLSGDIVLVLILLIKFF